MTGYMSAGGDSGSAVLDNDNKIVGLLYAGSNNSMIMNRIQNVFKCDRSIITILILLLILIGRN